MPEEPMLSLMDVDGELLHLYKDHAADDTHEATRTHIGDVLHRVTFLSKLAAIRGTAPPVVHIAVTNHLKRHSDGTLYAPFDVFVFVPYEFPERVSLGCHQFDAADTAKLLAWALDESYTMPAPTKVEFRRIAA